MIRDNRAQLKARPCLKTENWANKKGGVYLITKNRAKRTDKSMLLAG